MLVLNIAAKLPLNALIGGELGSQESLIVFLLLDLFVYLGDLLSSAPDLRSLVVDSFDLVFVEPGLEALLLLAELFCLLTVLFKRALQIVYLRLVLVTELFDCVVILMCNRC